MSRKKGRREEDERGLHRLGSEDRQIIRNAVDSALKPSTLKSYRRDIQVMKAWLKGKGFEEDDMDAALFSLFIATNADTSVGSTKAKAFRSAASHEIACGGWKKNFTEEGMVAKAVRGLDFRSIQRKITQGGLPGTIDLEKLQQIVGLMEENETPESHQFALMVIFFGILRRTQAINLEIGCVNKESKTFGVVGDKRFKAGTAIRSERYQKSYIGDEFPILVEQLEKETLEPEGRIFGILGVQIVNLDAWIKMAASRFNWPKNLRWSLHCLRHGGAQRVEALVNQGVISRDKASDACTMCESVFRHYTMKDEVKLQMIEKQQQSQIQEFWKVVEEEEEGTW